MSCICVHKFLIIHYYLVEITNSDDIETVKDHLAINPHLCDIKFDVYKSTISRIGNFSSLFEL